MNWPGPVTFGFAVTLALVMVRLFTWPVAPIVPNMPILTPKALGAMGAMVRLLMVFPRPSNLPVNGPPAAADRQEREARHVEVGRAERVVLRQRRGVGADRLQIGRRVDQHVLR